jgi:hypothetical protein
MAVRSTFRKRVVDQRASRFCKGVTTTGKGVRREMIPTFWLHELECGHWEERRGLVSIGRKLKCHSCEVGYHRGGRFAL